jgi:ethanolamine transporter EutH
MVGRGAGWGALLGATFGIFVFPVADLLTFRDDPFTALSFLLGVLTAPFGLLYGAVAGSLAATCFVPLSSVKSPALVARVVSATVAPLAVGLVSRVVFHPSMLIGANETSEHVLERFVMFYGYPCVAAFLAGAVWGGRLARPIGASPN